MSEPKTFPRRVADKSPTLEQVVRVCYALGIDMSVRFVRKGAPLPTWGDWWDTSGEECAP